MIVRVLVVDDDQAKVGLITAALNTSRMGDVQVASSASVIDAKSSLKETQFDLVILDIALPIRSGEEPKNDAGLELLREIQTRAIYKRPQHIIGLTSYASIYTAVADEFAASLWSVVLYDQTSEGWADQLGAKLRHIEGVKGGAEVGGAAVDLCIVAALGDPELDAILKLDWGWKIDRYAGDATVYHRGTFTTTEGKAGTVVAARAGNMGMASSAVLAMKMALHFRPRVMAMVGICAGDSTETSIGDVVVGNPTWDYGSGKYKVENGEHVFEPAIYQLPISARLRGLVEEASDQTVLDSISHSFSGETPTTKLRVHVGPLASGAAVLADELAYKAVQKQHRKLMGIDMEAYAVMLAGYEAPNPVPETIVLKGVSDFADTKKGDRFRYYAAHVSAQFLAHLAEKKGL